MDKANWKLAFLVALVALITIHGSAFADSVVFTRHTVTVPLWIEDKLRYILTENNRTGTFAVTDISYRNDLYLVSVAQLPDGIGDDWRLDQAIDLFVVAINDTVGAVQGSKQFEALTEGILAIFHLNQIAPGVISAVMGLRIPVYPCFHSSLGHMSILDRLVSIMLVIPPTG